MLLARNHIKSFTRFPSKSHNARSPLGQHPSRPLGVASRSPSKQPTISKDDLNYYGNLMPAKPAELLFASKYFAQAAPSLLLTATHFRMFPPSFTPEVALLGRSNVGKSSLLNALLNRTNKAVAYVSSKPGRTRTMNAYGLGGVEEALQKETDARTEKTKRFWKGDRGIVVVDMPGYGKGSREEWGEEIVKYMAKREQLRRAFLLIDSEHGVTSNDERILEIFADTNIPYQLILSKVDKLLPSKIKFPLSPEKLIQMQDRVHEACRMVDERAKRITGQDLRKEIILACAAGSKLKSDQRLGINGVRWAILEACSRLIDAKDSVRSP